VPNLVLAHWLLSPTNKYMCRWMDSMWLKRCFSYNVVIHDIFHANHWLMLHYVIFFNIIIIFQAQSNIFASK
jgi:hypothetical protein